MWGFGLPLSILGLIPVTAGWSPLLGLTYPLLVEKIYQQRCDLYSRQSAAYYAIFCVKMPMDFRHRHMF
jgi:hypothetical protein